MDELQAGLDPLSSENIDSDGMPDDWERFYFGDLSRDGTGDFDGDGMSDLDEYTAHRHPNTAIQYGTLKFTYAANSSIANVVYMTDYNEENSLTVSYTDSTQTKVSQIKVHLDVSWGRLIELGNDAPTMATYDTISDTNGYPTYSFTSHTIQYHDRDFVGMDILRKIDGIPYLHTTVGGVSSRVYGYTAITSQSVAVVSAKKFPSIIRDFPYGSPEFIDFGRRNNNDNISGSFIAPTLGVDGLPVSTLTDNSSSRMIHGADSFRQWYRNPDTLSVNMGPGDDGLYSGNYGMAMSNQYPFTKLTSSAGGYNNQYCWTTEVHARLVYDVDPESANPTYISYNTDDDLFVFINGHRIIDRPGIPGGSGYRLLSELLADSGYSLPTNTGTAEIVIFHAERREFASQLNFQTSTPLLPVYAYQVIADTRLPGSVIQYSLGTDAPNDMTIDPNTGKILWDYSSASLGTYSFMVNITDNRQNQDSQTVSFLYGAEPEFTTKPTGGYYPEGETITLTAVATGYPTPTYQWYKGDVAIPGSTSLTYSITSGTFSDNATYKIVATNAVGTTKAETYVYFYSDEF